MIERWYEQNIAALHRIYGDVAYDLIKLKWIEIVLFVLPPNFKQPYSSLLITTPGTCIDNHDGYKFYLDLGLKRTCHDREQHIFEDHSYNDLYHAGWARLSFHLEQFHPAPNAMEGDNLLHVVQSTYNFLGQRW